MYFKYTGTTLEDLKAQMKPQAERQVKVRLALEKIVELENIAATEEDVEAEYKTIADAYKMEIEKVKEALDAEAVKKDLAMRKASDFIKENAKVTEVSAEEKEKAAKEAAEKAEAEKAEKPAAKKRTTKKAAEKADDEEKAEKPKTTRKKKTETAETEESK